jgi:hypothetical protein
MISILTVLTSLVAGCAHGGGDDASAPADQGGDQALSTSSSDPPLSQDLLCAAVKAADDSNDGQDLKSIPEGNLKGDALRDFKAFQKGMASDFPSQAFALPVKLASKTFSFIMVLESNDGGQEIGVYRTDGSTVATISNGESEPGTWSKPADKCPQ